MTLNARRLWFLSALLLVVAWGLASDALEIEDRFDAPGAPYPNRLYLTFAGEIETGDDILLRAVLANYADRNFRELVVTLDSPGGSLAAALQIAEILRRRSELVRTHVGYGDRPEADCASACALVFVAGTLRYLGEGGRIGVHQFYSDGTDLDVSSAIDMAQRFSSRIVRLLDRQGVDADFFDAMSSTSGREVDWLSRDKLEQWRVVTGDVFDARTEYININGKLSLRMEHRSLYGDNAMTLICSDEGAVVGVTDLDEPEDSVYNRFFVVIDGVAMAPETADLIPQTERRTHVVFRLFPYQARLLIGASSIGSRVLAPEGNKFWGFEQRVRDTRLREFVEGCGGGGVTVGPGLRTEKGVDYYGSDLYLSGIRNISLETCIKTCVDDIRCVAVSYVEVRNWCWPKFSTENRRYTPGIISVLKP